MMLDQNHLPEIYGSLDGQKVVVETSDGDIVKHINDSVCHGVDPAKKLILDAMDPSAGLGAASGWFRGLLEAAKEDGLYIDTAEAGADSTATLTFSRVSVHTVASALLARARMLAINDEAAEFNRRGALLRGA